MQQRQALKSWFTIKAAVSGADTADISIHDEIGVWGVSARQFIDQFKAIDAPKVVLSLNSPGGSVMDALAIFTTLRASGKHVTIKVIGIAASAASYLMLAGDHVTMPANTFAMLHNPLAGVYGHADDMREMAEVLDKLGTSLRATYAKRTGKSDDEIAELLSKDTWLTAQECLDLGLCDEVTPELKVAANYELQNLPAHIQALLKPVEIPAAAQIEPPTASRPSATEVQSLLAAVQLAEYTEAFALDDSLTTVDALQAAIADATEIVALCRICERPNDAAGFIKARKPLAEVRAALIEARAAKDQHIDTTRRDAAAPVQTHNKGAEPNPVKRHLDFWARRNQRSTNPS